MSSITIVRTLHDDDCALLAKREKAFCERHGIAGDREYDTHGNPTTVYNAAQSYTLNNGSERAKRLTRLYWRMVNRALGTNGVDTIDWCLKPPVCGRYNAD